MSAPKVSRCEALFAGHEDLVRRECAPFTLRPAAEAPVYALLVREHTLFLDVVGRAPRMTKTRDRVQKMIARPLALSSGPTMRLSPPEPDVVVLEECEHYSPSMIAMVQEIIRDRRRKRLQYDPKSQKFQLALRRVAMMDTQAQLREMADTVQVRALPFSLALGFHCEVWY
jgi:hypothetical protein